MKEDEMFIGLLGAAVYSAIWDFIKTIFKYSVVFGLGVFFGWWLL